LSTAMDYEKQKMMGAMTKTTLGMDGDRMRSIGERDTLHWGRGFLLLDLTNGLSIQVLNEGIRCLQHFEIPTLPILRNENGNSRYRYGTSKSMQQCKCKRNYLSLILVLCQLRSSYSSLCIARQSRPRAEMEMGRRQAGGLFVTPGQFTQRSK
jgi:hypothetical protein